MGQRKTSRFTLPIRKGSVAETVPKKIGNTVQRSPKGLGLGLGAWKVLKIGRQGAGPALLRLVKRKGGSLA